MFPVCVTVNYMTETICLFTDWPSVYLHFESVLEHKKNSLKGTKCKTSI